MFIEQYNHRYVPRFLLRKKIKNATEKIITNKWTDFLDKFLNLMLIFMIIFHQTCSSIKLFSIKYIIIIIITFSVHGYYYFIILFVFILLYFVYKIQLTNQFIWFFFLIPLYINYINIVVILFMKFSVLLFCIFPSIFSDKVERERERESEPTEQLNIIASSALWSSRRFCYDKMAIIW